MKIDPLSALVRGVLVEAGERRASSVTFRVDGIPATKGSARAVTSNSTGRAVLLASGSKKNARDQKSWARAVGWAAKIAWGSRPILIGEVRVVIDFWLPRRKGDVGERPTQKRDGDKLERSCWDSMSGLVYRDDGQVVSWAGERWFADGVPPGARITVGPALPARSE